ncbi:MAG: AAA family ATPase, partial [Leptolyngbyaceae cyanobacterium MO_188.B28]|nr:AAA family ATPase [Leptolyngbyaceae cyanobacterium MO_188.B28]
MNLDPLAQTEHPPNQHFLLEQVIYRHPLVVAPETPLAEIIDLMSQSLTGICFLTEDDSPLNDSLVDRFSTSCVLVMVDTQLLGIFTEWDMVRLIATGGTLTGLAIADVMTRQVITLKATDARDVFPALNLMRQHRIRHLPILDEQDQLLGIVTPEAVRRTLQPTDLLRLRQVEEVMTPQAIHALSSASVLQVAQLITQHQVSCVVIVDAAAAQRRSPITQQTGQQPVANHRRQNPKSIDEQSEASRRVSQNSLWTLCRLQARPNLDDLAQRIEAVATSDDLVLPDQQRQVIEDIATHLNHRARVYQDWGFAQKGDRGLGVSALFYGESGTGKTMAAEVLANTCQLDLYRIDLSTVVSKYIGETEKNLRRIFDAAETGGVILLFDEADALFGQRSEVKDSHDRHANIEVSYLLQRMEAYQGLAILTSNMKNALDQAFLRRIRFMAPFPFPDGTARAEIWRRIFPKNTPTQNLDY